MKPMLAATAQTKNIQYPVYATPKLDGIRGVIVDGQLRSRSLKPIPNPFVSKRFSLKKYEGLDGELILGSPTAKDVYRVTNSACSRHEGKPDVKFYVFDYHDMPGVEYAHRQVHIKTYVKSDDTNIVIVGGELIHTEKELLEYEENTLNEGYEGLILRGPESEYKYGRSTLKEGGMLKLKRFTDGEAYVIDIEEEMENTNEAKRNELGRTQRSSAKSGLVGKGRAGTLVVVDCKTNIQFRIGSGLDDKDAAWFWKHREDIINDGGYIVKYKSFLIGVKDLPRHPVYLGGRESWDM